jgi:hypothetical protein
VAAVVAAENRDMGLRDGVFSFFSLAASTCNRRESKSPPTPRAIMNLHLAWRGADERQNATRCEE